MLPEILIFPSGIRASFKKFPAVIGIRSTKSSMPISPSDVRSVTIGFEPCCCALFIDVSDDVLSAVFSRSARRLRPSKANHSADTTAIKIIKIIIFFFTGSIFSELFPQYTSFFVVVQKFKACPETCLPERTRSVQAIGKMGQSHFLRWL